MATNLFYKRDGNYIVCAIGPVPPTDVEWEGYIEFIAVQAKLGVVQRAVVLTDGGAPTARQRERMTDRLAAFSTPRLRIAVVTDSTMARAAVTAISWLTGGYRAYAPAQLEDALAWIEVPTHRRAAMKALADELRGRVRAERALKRA